MNPCKNLISSTKVFGKKSFLNSPAVINFQRFADSIQTLHLNFVRSCTCNLQIMCMYLYVFASNNLLTYSIKSKYCNFNPVGNSKTVSEDMQIISDETESESCSFS